MPHLRDGLHHRQVDRTHIFFDLSADRYFTLSGSDALTFDRYLVGSACASGRARLAALDLIPSGPGRERSGSFCAPVPTTSLVDRSPPIASFLAVVHSLLAQRQVRRSLRDHGLPAIVHRIQGAGGDLPVDADLCAKVAAGFSRARLFASADDQCLVRGLAMKLILARRGSASTLVFGVTMPFAAHCWVQADAMVLTDRLEVVQRYQPIFAF